MQLIRIEIIIPFLVFIGTARIARTMDLWDPSILDQNIFEYTSYCAAKLIRFYNENAMHAALWMWLSSLLKRPVACAM